MGEELYLKYRPKVFKHVFGQEAATKTLSKFIKNGNVPHSILFSGPSGVGKTTLARILKTKLNCGDPDFTEINAAESRGIDTVREVIQQIRLAPISGDCRIWLWDECFVPGTLINTPVGNKPIEQMKPGDKIYNLDGVSVVEKVFENKVSLNRLIKVKFDNGTEIYCSKEHLFYTNKGWIEAYKLSRDHYFNCLSSRDNYENRQEMCNLSGKIYDRYSKTKKNLFKKMRLSFNNSNQRTNTSKCQSYKKMRGMWESNGGRNEIKNQILQSALCRSMEDETARIHCKNTQSTSKQENIRSKIEVFSNGGREEARQGMFGKNETKEPNASTRNYRQNGKNQGLKWNSSCLDWGTRWEWEDNQAREDFIGCNSNGIWWGLEVPTGYSYEKELEKRRTLPPILQSGYWEQGINDSDRGGWQNTWLKGCDGKRQQERNVTRIVRVDGIEVYEQGSGRESFSSVISDKERIQGYKILYDLQVKGNHSYYVHGIPVHNCHQLSKRAGGDAQTALLKVLEECPPHVYFFLCTTDPKDLLPTIHSRCTQVKLVGLTSLALKQTVGRVLEEEKKTLPESVINKLVEVSDNCARKVLVLLHQIIGLDTEQEQLDVLGKADVQRQAIEICRLLLNPSTKWNKLAPVINNLKETEEVESVRHMVLSYCLKCMMNEENQPENKMAARASYIVSEMMKPFYDSKWAGFTAVCYEIIRPA